MKETKYNFRHLAKVTIEAITPIAVGSGDADFLTDATVAKDCNGLAYIPGTALAGIFRHAFPEKEGEKIFGFQDQNKPENSQGSDIIFSSAHLVVGDNKVVDGLMEISSDDPFLSHFTQLPIRQHVRINRKGTTDKGGKFDNEVVYKGTRWAFEIEMLAEENQKDVFKKILNKLSLSDFRIGSNTRSGLGEIKVIECKLAHLNLKDRNDLDLYINKTSDLNDAFWNHTKVQRFEPATENADWDRYELELSPDDFFLFGSGFGNQDADITPVTEGVIRWEGNTPKFEQQKTLIPASSLKGALSHRTAFHYNKTKRVFADQQVGIDALEKENEAVVALFGTEDKDNPKRGNVIFSDVILDETLETKVINHVTIDRFTGGAIEGMLFSESPNFGQSKRFTCHINVPKKIDDDADKSKKFIQAFKSALKDLCTGMLPLGGGVNRGNGCFTGNLKINNKFEEL